LLRLTQISLRTSVVILAGGFSKRFGEDKALLKLARKPLILHILDRIITITDEALVVVSSKNQVEHYSRILPATVEIVVDEYKIRTPLVGAMTGFKRAKGKYTLLLPCDTPFVSRSVAVLLLQLCIDRDAAIPRWPNSYLEPLHAAYSTKSALTAARMALEKEQLNMRSMIKTLDNVRYVNVDTIKKIDPDLMTFFNINVQDDLRRAEKLLQNLRASSYSGL